MSNDGAITVKKDGAITTITYDRQEKLNALTAKMSRELLAAIADLDGDDTASVGILTGAGRAFSVGGDLALEETFTAHTFRLELEMFAETVMAILSCSKPIICKMNGHAVGWGATMALFCDIIIASNKAKIGDPHVNVGLSTGDGASVIWPQLAGYPRAKQYLLTGELMGAVKAERWGLVNEVCRPEQLDDRVLEIAQLIAEKPRLSVAMTKASVNIALKQAVRSAMDSYITYECTTQQHPDHLIAVRRFMNTRKSR
ncbi:enoyl-CoA hydratase/isomerase family protein [Aurantiacibacter zhengii]|uniref:Enoyl-CoA hydratase/isomerase family protein n=1 Tax=Aurantiacibacter zhengii TaxID=2307003 RepID=A0A418NVD9_9SPHN|nr:enoyl-CoA hydratase/isomerase family protein [Aurantiacibacter zhengii]RIV87981.1 enoyl-CoA hydratase/isomerase family protein [Aurantiacibacter zhengii]